MLYALLALTALTSPAHADGPQSQTLHGSSAVQVLALSYDTSDQLYEVTLQDGRGHIWHVTEQSDAANLSHFGSVFEQAAEARQALWVHGSYGQLLDVAPLPAQCGVRCAETLMPLWNPSRSLPQQAS